MPGDPYEHHQVNNFVDYRIDMLRKTSDGERMKKIVEAEKETSGVIESEQLLCDTLASAVEERGGQRQTQVDVVGHDVVCLK